MARIHLLYNPISDQGLMTGGNWVSTLPVNNLRTQQPSQVARTVDAAATSTTFRIDSGTMSSSWQVFALIGHNLSAAATVRIRVGNTVDGTTGALTNLVLDRLSPAVGSQAITRGLHVYRHPSVITGRYVEVVITDTANPAGYIQIGRFMAEVAFVPAINMTWGASIGLTDLSTQSRSEGGQIWSDVRPKFRTLTAAFDALSDAEAYSGGDTPAAVGVMDMMEKLGTHGNLLAVYDPDDTGQLLSRRTIYGRLVGLTPLTEISGGDRPHTWSVQVEELL